MSPARPMAMLKYVQTPIVRVQMDPSAHRGRQPVGTARRWDRGDVELTSHFGLERAVASHRLAGAAPQWPEEPLNDVEWSALLDRVQIQWSWRMLAAAIRDRALPASPTQTDEALSRAADAAINDLHVESRLVQVCQEFEGAGVEYRALKGATTARRVYRDPELRSFADVDVLVGGDDFDRAVEIIERRGGRRRYEEARAGFDRRFSKGASFSMPDGVAIDLHRTFVLGPYGFTVDLEGILARGAQINVAGHVVQALEIHDAAAHACMHAALGQWPPILTPVRDVVEFLTHPSVDPVRVLERAAAWRIEAVVARAVSFAVELLGCPEMPLAGWARSYRPRFWEPATVGVYGPGRSSRQQSLAALAFVPGGSRARLEFARALALPDRSYLATRDGSYIRRILRATEGLSDLLHRGGRS